MSLNTHGAEAHGSYITCLRLAVVEAERASSMVSDSFYATIVSWYIFIKHGEKIETILVLFYYVLMIHTLIHNLLFLMFVSIALDNIS